MIECAETCIFAEADHRNCGGCGVRCGDDQGCEEGVCVPWCPTTPVADADALIALIAESAQPEHAGRSGSFEAASDITVTQADLAALGDAAFVTGLTEGAELGPEASGPFGELADCTRDARFITPWYESITVSAGTRFLLTIDSVTLTLQESTGGCCYEEDVTGQYCYNDSLSFWYCMLPGCGCCCSPDPMDPVFVIFKTPPQECVTPPECPETWYTGQTPDTCLDDYEIYLWYADIEVDCVDELGYLIGEGSECTYEQCQGDVIMPYPGECGLDGRCHRVLD